MKQTTLIVFIDLSWREFKGHLFWSSGKMKLTQVKGNLLNRNAIYFGMHAEMVKEAYKPRSTIGSQHLGLHKTLSKHFYKPRSHRIEVKSLFNGNSLEFIGNLQTKIGTQKKK